MQRFSMAFDKIAGPVFLFLGVVFFAVGLFDIDRARRSNLWPKTQGVILGSWPGEDSEGFNPKVRYSYNVGGTVYQSKRIRFGSSETTDRSVVDAWIAKNKVDATVPVYYDPVHPTEVVLKRGIYARLWLYMGLGISFGLVGLFLLRVRLLNRLRTNFT